MWLPRGLSADGASIYIRMGRASPKGALARNRGIRNLVAVAVQKTKFDMSSTQHLNVKYRDGRYTTSGALRRERDGLPRGRESCLSTVVVEHYHREPRAVAVESDAFYNKVSTFRQNRFVDDGVP